jgi:hypothetical protein
MMLFFTNMVLFGTVIALVFFSFIPIPILGGLGIVASMVCWTLLAISWKGNQKNKRKMAFIGSSFYLVMTVLFIYRYLTIEPEYPGDDLFMAYIGLDIGMLMTVVAFFTCFFIAGQKSRI